MDRVPRTAIACLAVAAAALAFWRAPLVAHSIQDDGFIYFRIARNLAEGHGPVFTPGERVDAASSPVWTALLAACIRLGISPLTAAGALGLASAIAAIVLCARWSLELCGVRSGVAVAAATLAAMVLALDVRFQLWAASGMETALAALVWLAATRALVAHWYLAKPSRWTGVWALAAALVRPEFVLLVTGMAAVAIAKRSAPWKAVLRSLWPAIAGGALYLVAHTIYFGDPLPNTYYAKRASDGTHLRIGLAYLAALPRAYPWLVAALGLACVVPGRSRAAAHGGPSGRVIASGVGLGIVLYAVQVARLGGDHFVHHRPFVHVLPIGLALGGVALHQIWRRIPGGRVFAVILLLCASVAAAAQRLEPGAFAWVRLSAQLGHALAEQYPPSTRLGLFALGATGYTSGLPVVDALGIADPHVARRDLSHEHCCALDIGHERGDPDYVLQKADVVVFFSAYAPVPFEDLDEIRDGFHSHRRFVEIARAHVARGEFRLRNVAFARGLYWAVLEKNR